MGGTQQKRAIMDSKTRFSNRVDDYVRARPRYPREAVEYLRAAAGLGCSSLVADIGAGTGISTELFLNSGNEVFAVEPNDAMRQAAERRFAGDPRFHSVNGSAEATGLASGSVNFVVAAQAFHWFNTPAARREMARILKPGGTVILMWNVRRADSTPFLRAYSELLQRYGTDYALVRHERTTEAEIAAFFGGPFRTWENPHFQELDFDGLLSRLLSSSYVPAPGEPHHDAIVKNLRDAFDANRSGGVVRMEYDLRIYHGRLVM
jgi:ubiquinone/menaquinone biosynthesis C-methylase UbiE